MTRELRELVTIAMTPELRLLASSLLWTIFGLSRRKAECTRRFICRTTTLKLQKKWLHNGSSHREKAPQVRGFFFYIGHTGMPTKAKLNAWADKVMRIKLPTVAVWNGPSLIRISAFSVDRCNAHYYVS